MKKDDYILLVKKYKRQILQLEHEKILAALRLRHMEEAKAVARGHIDNQEITVLKNLKERKEV